MPDEGSGTMERRGTLGEVFGAFLRLGLTSFGGPIAHLGYFRSELVVRRRWIDEASYGELVALCQFLPGPASSQTGFLLGWMRAGPLGAFAAWAGFTLPSALIMLALGLGVARLDGAWAGPIVHGLKLVAVAIVAQAVWGMARTLAPDRRRRMIAIAAVGVVTLAGGAFGQLGAILLGAGAGLLLCRTLAEAPGRGGLVAIPRAAAIACLALFGALLILLPLLAGVTGWRGMQLFDIFYRAGALVFGGGHVVLPLLRAGLVPAGWIGDDRFLAGYGAAQALPGPLFAIAAYLGAVAGGGVAGAATALIGIFAPGLLIVTGALPFWSALRTNAASRSIVAGVNAAVVGILAAALYDPLWTTAVSSWADVALIALGLFALLRWRAPPIAVVALMIAGALVRAALQ